MQFLFFEKLRLAGRGKGKGKVKKQSIAKGTDLESKINSFGLS